ncbi:MAG TPA: hypothetical protein VMA73_18640 [Streptosporangiaceae bacterium]|nr:hypothetical protein [Streptosporangiaceae bacterium]
MTSGPPRPELGGLAPAEWDELARDHFYSSSGWLRLCAAAAGLRCRGLAIRLADGERGAVPVAVVDQPLSGNYDWNAPLADIGQVTLPGRGLLVGPALGYHTRLLPGTDSPRVTVALLDEVRRLSEAVAGGESACVAMYLPTADARALADAGATAPPVLIEPEAWFEVPPGGWEPWVASLRQTQRRRVRRDVRKFEALNYRIRRETLANCMDRIVPLAVELAVKRGYNADPHRFETEFQGYVDATGDAAQVALCETHDGRLMSFCLYYVWGDVIYLRWSASRYSELPDDGAEYFNVGYYSQVRLAGEIGARWLHAGKKAISAKVLRGGLLRPLWMLDLSRESLLTYHAAEIREHNAMILNDLQMDGITARAIADPAEWELFC